jgi:hypothetical protein
MTTYVFANLKGGTAKTTSAAHFLHALAVVGGGAVVLVALTGCGSAGQHSAGAVTSMASPTPVSSSRPAASTAPGTFSATPFASTVTGTVVADTSGKGAQSLGPLPRAGSLNVIYNCAAGSMTVTRKPDIKATFTCVGGPSLITFGATKVVNNNPVNVSMTDQNANWRVQLVLS